MFVYKIIRVNTYDIRRSCTCNPFIDCGRQPHVLFVTDIHNVTHKHLESRLRLVSAAIINNNDLVFVASKVLIDERTQATANELFMVVRGNYDRNERRLHTAKPSISSADRNAMATF